MLFNENTKLTLGQIASETNIPDLELRRHLISLCTPKHRVLRKGSKGKGISGDDDTFTFNPEYKSNARRVKIPLVSIRDVSKNKKLAGAKAANPSASGNEVLPLQLEEERRHLVEAATVRIMKARKQLHHNDLIAEVTKQLQVRFVPTPQFIKKRIEGLIEREYLERDEQDHRLYMYVA
jgi:cullin 3